MNNLTIDVLLAARRIADYAENEGILIEERSSRFISTHIGAILADSVLQAGLNYQSVVLPRIQTILERFPEMSRLSNLVALIEQRKTGIFLNWEHPQKIQRFEELVFFLKDKKIEYVKDLHNKLKNNNFTDELLTINGIGPKTVDYMACLTGIDSIAVDRHVRTFARRLGVENEDYQYLQKVFCCAADLLELPRRDFDSWVWKKESAITSPQLRFTM